MGPPLAMDPTSVSVSAPSVVLELLAGWTRPPTHPSLGKDSCNHTNVFEYVVIRVFIMRTLNRYMVDLNRYMVDLIGSFSLIG